MKPFIANLLSRACITVQHDHTLRQVAGILSGNNIGAVPVLDDAGHLAGIISERDLVRTMTEKITLDTGTAADLMTRQLVTASSDISSSELMTLMTQHKIRHIPIVDGQKLRGIVSIGDVVKRLLEKLETETEQLRHFINS
ncbi:MAG: CBS domain-containing protein [Candidatus Puniceispirillaceae bacterium]|nr:CBS domain-containing protein [Pseudomonadota bacterium]